MADPIDVGVGARIRVRRRELRVTQESLGKHLGLTFQQVQKYERGSNRVSASMLVRIAGHLRCSVAYLVGEEEGAAGDLDGALLARLAAPGVAEVVEAFSAIEKPALQKAIIKLMQSMAEED